MDVKAVAEQFGVSLKKSLLKQEGKVVFIIHIYVFSLILFSLNDLAERQNQVSWDENENR